MLACLDDGLSVIAMNMVFVWHSADRGDALVLTWPQKVPE